MWVQAISDYLGTLTRREKVENQLLINVPLNNDTYDLILSGGKNIKKQKQKQKEEEQKDVLKVIQRI